MPYEEIGLSFSRTENYWKLLAVQTDRMANETRKNIKKNTKNVSYSYLVLQVCVIDCSCRRILSI